MKDEIKKILDMLKNSKYIPSDDNRTYKLLDKDDTRHLLDYITNLQEELKSANESITWWTNRYNAVRKEIDRLNKECDTYMKIATKRENIIGELELYIRSYINLLVKNPDMIEQGQLDILYEVLDKIKELKGDNNGA